MTHTFRWTCSYLGCIEFEISNPTERYLAEFRHAASDYELSICNGDDVRRDALASIGILRRKWSTDAESRAWRESPETARLYQVPSETVAAFNAWRFAEQRRRIADIESQPHRYGILADGDPIRKPPLHADSGYYVCGKGWTRVEVSP
jgi:hypothetical protein